MMTMTLKDTVAEDAALEVAEFTPAARKPEPKPVDVGSINTLHELLALAIGDFEKVLADKQYIVDMNQWHTPQEDGRCHVCLAGSVMAKSLDADKSNEIYSFSLGRKIQRRLEALNELRCGRVAQAWGLLHRKPREDAGHVIAGLNEKWDDAISYKMADARNRRDGRKLLALLKLMHADLAEAGI